MRVQSFSDINFQDHHLLDMIWPIKSARTGQIYDVQMVANGFTCNCMAGSTRGKCKHVKYVHDLLVGDSDQKYDIF